MKVWKSYLSKLYYLFLKNQTKWGWKGSETVSKFGTNNPLDYLINKSWLKKELRRAQENIHSLQDVLTEGKLREQLEDLMDREQIMWAQKAKKDWDIKGDRNTKKFQAVVRARRRRNQISQIKTQDNKWLSDHQEIEQHFVDHYINLFSDT